ncbi:malonyl-CoA O-methyltransferase [Hypnocyclicus thermotrophus]|uniref:Malonyl-CoA O-methyltransferase n=1 Tax=Hypnocyclicus thermotrophus TaxID=1627895 RepID=A0AA46I692_9FUSO|nr:methyltransferase domain-containing protein [Hypnocyclicus thermotrophus]TDT71895.1 malonyl-CoA O-methyltransferase [Hypnocyclicus thermotrophus]
MINKKYVQNNFSKSVNSYDSYAKIQKIMAQDLYNFLPNIKNPKILEIGCGTGIFTEYLFKKYENMTLDVVDISNDMIDIVKLKYKDKINSYIVCDAEEYLFKNQKYDLIVSNAVFQWFNNLEKTLDYYKTILNNNGKIIFATFIDKTYYELRNAFYEYNKDFIFSQKFIKLEYFKKRKDIEILKNEHYIERYNNLLEFLKSIKKIGANSALQSRKLLTKNILRNVEKKYIELYKEIKVTNDIIYAKIELL